MSDERLPTGSLDGLTEAEIDELFAARARASLPDGRCPRCGEPVSDCNRCFETEE